MLTIMVEVTKHCTEHRTKDTYRRAALSIIYGELMMLGVDRGPAPLRAPGARGGPSLAAAARRRSPAAAGCPACPDATGGSSSSSGDPCTIGFDLLMFEYAHLVIFWMGLSYCAFIQYAFRRRQEFVSEVDRMQRESTLYTHYAQEEGELGGTPRRQN
eukprot:gene22565-28502_t